MGWLWLDRAGKLYFRTKRHEVLKASCDFVVRPVLWLNLVLLPMVGPCDLSYTAIGQYQKSPYR